MTPNGVTASDISTVINDVPRIAGHMPPSVLALRGSAVKNSHQRAEYRPILPPRPSWFAG